MDKGFRSDPVIASLSTDETMQEFDYDLSRLEDPSKAIRLLKLFPSEVWEFPLQCSLVTTVLQERCTPFRALSYVWGDDPTTNHAIHVFQDGLLDNQKPSPPAEETKGFIPITFSLDEALRHIRSPKDTTTLWIDQICIHQADDAERAQQVGLMGQLYATATQVLVWLGPAHDEYQSDAVMAAWQAVGQEARDWGMESYYTRERHHLLPLKMYNVDPADEDTRKLQDILARAAEVFAPLLRAGALKAWFDRAWFSRLWVVQEFCMCPDTVFVCGFETVAVELVMLAMQVLHGAIANSKSPTGRFAVLESVPAPRLWEMRDEPTGRLFSCRQRRQKFARGEQGAKGDQLHALLRKLFVEHDTRATRHRDRIYGLLGLAVDSKQLNIPVDYTPGQAPRILTQAARAMIEIGGRVDVLCYSQFPKAKHLQGLPSWVPDWSANLRASYYVIHEEVDTHRYTACGESTVEAVKPPEGNTDILALRGYLVDTIERVADDAWTDMNWDPVRYLTYVSQFDELYRLSMEKEEPIHGEGITWHRKQEARWRVPIGDVYWTREEEYQRATPDVAAEHGRCVDNIHEFQIMSLLTGVELNERYASWEQRYNAGQIGADYRESMTIMKGKRPFLTQKGYLGMGPAETAPGDAAVIFCGGRIPFVLRPKTGTDNMWSFVGEAYCDGVMDGHIVNRRTNEVFHLC